MKRAKQATTIIALLLLCAATLSCMYGCTNEYSENLNKIFETEYFRCISYDNIHVTILALTEKGQRQTDSLIIPKEINGMEVNSLGGEIKGNSGYGIVNRERYRFYPRAHKIFFEGNYVLDDVKIDEDSIVFLINGDRSFLEKHSLSCYICAINNYEYSKYISPNIIYFKNLCEDDWCWFDYIVEGEEVTLPPVPVADNYQFMGWYKDSQGADPYDSEEAFQDTNEKLFLYAKWLAI